jgi:N-acetylglucosamine kinase-like BadF-type ATPase
MHYVLGFDGGGTKTHCVLLDSDRRIRSFSISGPSNPFRTSFEIATTELRTAAQMAANSAGINVDQITALCAGLAGVGSTESNEEMQRHLTTAFPNAKIRLMTDLELSLEATGRRPAIVLVAGTGSAAMGRDAQGRTARAGGHGPLISDQGSAYDVGRITVSVMVREHDRAGFDTPVGAEILRQLGFSNWIELRDRARVAADEVFPRVFPIVAAAAEGGLTFAQTLLVYAAREIAALAGVLIDRLSLQDAELFIAKTGGMCNSKFFDAQLDAQVKDVAPRATTGFLSINPAQAAANLALEAIASTPSRVASDTTTGK